MGAGRTYDLGTLDGLKNLTGDSLGVGGKPAIETTLGVGDAALAQIEVARADRMTVTFLQEVPGASFELYDPRGARSDHVSNPNVKLFSSPSIAVLEVKAPEAGTWSLRASGGGSTVRADIQIDNPMKLAIVPQPPIPVGQSGSLVAAATINGLPTPLPGAIIETTIRDAGGKAVVYKLLDDGRGVDRIAGDGLFSVAVPATEVQTRYDVDLKLSWANYGAVINGRGSLQSEVFPKIAIESVAVEPMQEGGKAAVAWIQIKVGEYPYPVKASDLTVRVQTSEGASVASTLQAVNPLSDGSAWQYQVLAAPAESGQYIATGRLDVVHLGRLFTATAVGSPSRVEILPPPPIPGTPMWVYGAAGAGILTVLAGMALGLNRAPHCAERIPLRRQGTDALRLLPRQADPAPPTAGTKLRQLRRRSGRRGRLRNVRLPQEWPGVALSRQRPEPARQRPARQQASRTPRWRMAGHQRTFDDLHGRAPDA